MTPATFQELCSLETGQRAWGTGQEGQSWGRLVLLGGLCMARGGNVSKASNLGKKWRVVRPDFYPGMWRANCVFLGAIPLWASVSSTTKMRLYYLRAIPALVFSNSCEKGMESTFSHFLSLKWVEMGLGEKVWATEKPAGHHVLKHLIGKFCLDSLERHTRLPKPLQEWTISSHCH